MKKGILTTIVTGTMMISMSMTAFAGWEQEGTNWKYNDNGTYVIDGWQWIDGNGDGIAESYCFDGNGYMLANTITPDGYVVNADGAWMVDGTIQFQMVSATNIENTGSASSDNIFATCAKNWDTYSDINEKIASLYIKEVTGNQLSCDVVFYRFMYFEFTGIIDSNGHATLFEPVASIQGELVFDGVKMVLTLNDQPNFYFDNSLSESLGKLRFVFQQQ